MYILLTQAVSIASVPPCWFRTTTSVSGWRLLRGSLVSSGKGSCLFLIPISSFAISQPFSGYRPAYRRWTVPQAPFPSSSWTWAVGFLSRASSLISSAYYFIPSEIGFPPSKAGFAPSATYFPPDTFSAHSEVWVLLHSPQFQILLLKLLHQPQPPW